MRGSVGPGTETLTGGLVGTDVPKMDGTIITGSSEHVGKVGTPGEVLDAALMLSQARHQGPVIIVNPPNQYARMRGGSHVVLMRDMRIPPQAIYGGLALVVDDLWAFVGVLQVHEKQARTVTKHCVAA